MAHHIFSLNDVQFCYNILDFLIEHKIKISALKNKERSGNNSLQLDSENLWWISNVGQMNHSLHMLSALQDTGDKLPFRCLKQSQLPMVVSVVPVPEHALELYPASSLWIAHGRTGSMETFPSLSLCLTSHADKGSQYQSHSLKTLVVNAVGSKWGGYEAPMTGM